MSKIDEFISALELDYGKCTNRNHLEKLFKGAVKEAITEELGEHFLPWPCTKEDKEEIDKLDVDLF